MTNLTNSEIVHNHIKTHPEAFLEALESASPETRESVLAYLQTFPEASNEQEPINPRAVLRCWAMISFESS